MSTHYKITAQGLTYLVVDDLTLSFPALMTGLVQDEVAGTPLAQQFTAEADRPGTASKIAGDGLYAVAGFVEKVFPDIATLPYNVTLTIKANGYRDNSVVVNVPINAAFPVQAPIVLLRPLPVRIQGRVVKEKDRTPIAGALVSTTTPKVVLLRTPTYFAHAKNVTIRARPLNPTGGAKQLAADAHAGSLALKLNSVAGLAANNVLRIGPDAKTDYAIIAALGSGPGELTLKSGLAHSFAAGTAVRRVTPGAVAASTQLARAADAGDGLLLLNANLSGTALEISDAPLIEYHDLNVLSDTEGFYALNAVGGVKTLDLVASAMGFTDLKIAYTLDYGAPLNILNFRLLP
jgi:hypothetical protein